MHGGGSSGCREGGGGGVLLFALPFCWIATAGLGLGCGPHGGYLDTAQTFWGLPHSASGWGLTAGWCDLPALFVRGARRPS